VSALILAIVKSTPFQMRGGAPHFEAPTPGGGVPGL